MRSIFAIVIYQTYYFVVFFFQAEDGIRDGRVTGVQTCALPIFGPLLARDLQGAPDDVGVECAGQAAVAGQRDHGHVLHIAAGQKRLVAEIPGGGRNVHRQLLHAVGVGPQRLDPGLRAAQAGARHQLHGLRDLLGVVDGADPPFDVLLGGHQTAAVASSSVGWKLSERDSAALRSSASVSSDNSPLSRMAVSTLPPASRYWISSAWKRGTSGTSTGSRNPLVAAQIDATWFSNGHGLYCGWLSVATSRWPRFSCCCVASSSSDANCA